nr:hypothetical protein [Psittacine picornavirus]
MRQLTKKRMRSALARSNARILLLSCHILLHQENLLYEQLMTEELKSSAEFHRRQFSMLCLLSQLKLESIRPLFISGLESFSSFLTQFATALVMALLLPHSALETDQKLATITSYLASQHQNFLISSTMQKPQVMLDQLSFTTVNFMSTLDQVTLSYRNVAALSGTMVHQRFAAQKRSFRNLPYQSQKPRVTKSEDGIPTRDGLAWI